MCSNCSWGRYDFQTKVGGKSASRLGIGTTASATRLREAAVVFCLAQECLTLCFLLASVCAKSSGAYVSRYGGLYIMLGDLLTSLVLAAAGANGGAMESVLLCGIQRSIAGRLALWIP